MAELPEQMPRRAGAFHFGGLGVHADMPRSKIRIAAWNRGSVGKGVHAQGCNMTDRLKFPAPYFGGKSKVAALVWQRLGDCDNVIEPFVGSGAVLLARPHPPKIETINDLDCYISCVWRALKHDPDGVAEFADDVVSEADLYSRHRFLVGVERPEPVVPERFSADPLAREAYLSGYLGEHRTYAAAFRQRMRQDPDYYDVRIAGWYLWGLSCWIGGGWCATHEDSERVPAEEGGRRPAIDCGRHHGNGVHAKGDTQFQQVPCLDAGRGGHPAPGDTGGPSLSQQIPDLSSGSVGVHAAGLRDGGRPQLADAYSRGRGVHNDNHLSQQKPYLQAGWSEGQSGQGVHANPNAGTCAQRRAWLVEWFGRLRDRLRTVRVCCGHWKRVCDSESVTTRLGVTGAFLDPPYPSHAADGTESRAAGLYATDGSKDALDALRDEVLAWCLERGPDPKMRIVVAGYDTDGYKVLCRHGWEEIAWRAAGGYGNRTKKGKANAGRERLWVSPHCVKAEQPGLFDALVDGGTEDA